MEKQNNWNQIRQDAESLRDEIKLQLHLAGMDARGSFEKLEKQAEGLRRKLGADSRKAWTDLVEGLKKVRDQIRADAGG